MSNKNPAIDPNLALSRRGYKKLGTIVEHLTECLNPSMFELRVMFTQNPSSAYIRVYSINPPINVVIFPLWELVWTPYFNGKMVIPKNLLSPWAEW